MLAAVAVAGGSGSPTPHVYALTLGSQADALGLTGTQFAAPTATKNGVSIAITGYAWTVSGPATLDNAAIAQPTPTHTGAGIVTRQLTATLADGAVVASAMDGWRVGDTSGLVTTYAPDLAALAAADWRSGGPGFSVGGQTITVRNQSTFATGVLGPDGISGLRFKPSSTSVNWSDADHSVGGVSLNLASLISGLTKNMPFDVIYAFRCDVDVSLDYQLFQVYVANNPHTSDPRGALVTRVNIAPNKILEASRRDGTTQVKVVLGTVATVRAIAWRIEGMTARLFYSTSAITSIPDASFTGWTEVPPYAMDIRDPNTAAQFTVADLTTGFNVGLAGTPAATLDLTVTGLWVRAAL